MLATNHSERKNIKVLIGQYSHLNIVNLTFCRQDKYKRALADGENVRRRMMKQVEDAKSFAIQSFCKDLLDVSLLV